MAKVCKTLAIMQSFSKCKTWNSETCLIFHMYDSPYVKTVITAEATVILGEPM